MIGGLSHDRRLGAPEHRQRGQPVALPGLQRPQLESVFLYQPESNWTYSHDPSITFFKNRFYAIWSNGRKDEDAPSQRVLMAAGFHQHDGTLVASFGNYGPNKETTHLQAVTTRDGEHWSAMRDVGVPVNPNHGPQRTASGRPIIAGNISFPYTDDPSGLVGWRMTGIYPYVITSRQEEAVQVSRVALADLD